MGHLVKGKRPYGLFYQIHSPKFNVGLGSSMVECKTENLNAMVRFHSKADLFPPPFGGWFHTKIFFPPPPKGHFKRVGDRVRFKVSRLKRDNVSKTFQGSNPCLSENIKILTDFVINTNCLVWYNWDSNKKLLIKLR